MTTPYWQSRYNLLASHGRLQSLLDELSNCIHTGDPALAQRAWTTLETAVLDHVGAEERELLDEYAAARPIEGGRIRKDHETIRSALADVGVRIDLHTVGEEQVAVLGRVLAEHAAYEERTVYQWVTTQSPKDGGKLRRRRSAGGRWRGSEPPR